MSRGATQISYTYQENTEKKGYCQLKKVSEDLKFKQLISENRLTSVHSSEPTLNDIFIDVTGRTLV
jgi:fluoroquinolone transport system ATP-binding protein